MTEEQARQIAARCWCEPETSGIEMDSRLAEAFALALLSASKPAVLLDDERGAFLTWWCADVPEYMREKWKENVAECLRNNNATAKLAGAWEGFQYALTLARPATR